MLGGVVDVPEALKPLDTLVGLSADDSDSDEPYHHTPDALRSVTLHPSPQRQRDASPQRHLSQREHPSPHSPDVAAMASAVYSASEDTMSVADSQPQSPMGYLDASPIPRGTIEEIDECDWQGDVSPSGTATPGDRSVWERLVKEGDARSRNREARHRLHQHREQLREEEEMRVPTVLLKRPWQPRKVQVNGSAQHTPRIGPGGEERGVPDTRFSFKPELSEATQVIATGSGAKVWQHLTKKKPCRSCSVSKGDDYTHTPQKLPKEEIDQAYSRLYKDAFKAKQDAHPVYSPKGHTFQPTISPGSERMVRNRIQPFSERLSRSSLGSPSVRRGRREMQTMEVSVSGAAIRVEANAQSERLRVLRRGDSVEVDVDSMRMIDDTLWGEVGDGWAMIVADDGERCFIPSLPREHSERYTDAGYPDTSPPRRSIPRPSQSHSPRARISEPITPSMARLELMQKRMELELEITKLSSQF